MKNVKVLFITILVFSASVFAEAEVAKICRPLSKKMGWHSGDTVRWVNKVVPALNQNIKESRTYATKNQTFKQSLHTVGYDFNQITESNTLRLQKECDINNLDSPSACHHFKSHCVTSIATDTLAKSLNSFSWCANNRSESCGESFKTAKGINANLQELELAVNQIRAAGNKINKDPSLSSYYEDVNQAFIDLEKKLAAAKMSAKDAKAKIEKEIEDQYARKKEVDDNFKHTCDVLDKCDDYLKKEDYADSYNLLDQTQICNSFTDSTEDELKPLIKLLSGLDDHTQKENLKSLAINSLNHSTEQTVKEYASVFNALNGRKPSKSELCREMPRLCKNETAQAALKSLDFSQIPKRDFLKDIKVFNESADKMNALCKQATNSKIDANLESKIQEQLAHIMYQTDLGRLMSVQYFREEVPPFNQESCFENGEGFKTISEDQKGLSLVKGATKSILKLQKEKSENISDQKASIQYAGKWTTAKDKDYFGVLKNVIRNDPLMIKEALKDSGDPEQALWICKATHDIYKDEKYETYGTYALTGLAIAGSLVATIFTFGAATPLLIASLAAGTSIGIYNLDKAHTARHNAEMAISIDSSERILASLSLESIDNNVKAAYVEVGMSLLPGAISGLKYAGKAVGPILKSSQLLKAVPIGSKVSAGSKALIKAIKSGKKVSAELIQKALASKLTNADPAKIAQFSEILVGASDDVVLESIVFASTFPDPPGPFSKEGMRTLAMGLSTSVGFSSLSVKGKTLVNSYNQKRQLALIPINSPKPKLMPKQDLQIKVSEKPIPKTSSKQELKIKVIKESKVRTIANTDDQINIEKASEQFFQKQKSIHEEKVKLPVNDNYSEASKLKIKNTQDEINSLMKQHSSFREDMLNVSNAALKKGPHLPDSAIDGYYTSVLNRVRATIKPSMKIKTSPMKAQGPPFEGKKYTTMDQIENDFDILARKRTPSRTDNAFHEVDEAFAVRGIPEKKLLLDDQNNIIVDNPANGDRVFSIGWKGARDFEGGYSSTGPTRQYGLVFKKGFTQNYGADLRYTKSSGKVSSHATPNDITFKKDHADQGKVFAIRAEGSTQHNGQVHVQFKEGWKAMDIDGQTMSQKDWMNSNVQGVVEFDMNGNILRFIEIPHE